jgi:hypothetical protein
VFTRAEHRTLSWVRWTQFISSRPTYLRSIHALAFLHVVRLKFCMYFSSFHPCYIARQSHPPWFYYPGNIWWGVQITKLLLRTSLHGPLTSPLLHQNILLTTVYWIFIKILHYFSTVFQVTLFQKRFKNSISISHLLTKAAYSVLCRSHNFTIITLWGPVQITKFIITWYSECFL